MASSKRGASSDLNHNNWDEEEEPEIPGSFAKASEDILRNRVIKVAKRRNPISSSVATSTPVGEVEKTGVFANFAGFSKSPATASTSSQFSFLSNIKSSAQQPKTNGLGGVTNITTTTVDNFVSDDKPKEYYAKLKGLNQSVSNWIKKHVDTNPLLNLTPIFRDYEKYLKEIECLDSTKTVEKVVTTESSATTTNIFKLDDSNIKTTSIFSNVKKPDVPTFTFGKTNTSATNVSSAGFTFGTDPARPFSFTNVQQSVETTADQDNHDEESDEPPKVTFSPVVEEGHIYSTRCKVFIKNGEVYSDRGVGALYLKPISSSDKVQLIVRADNSLGSLLCNFILSSNIPMQRMGKKDVMLVCIPLPDVNPPPVPVLLRVKSPEDADELLKTLEKHKK